jgi:stage II sporulation protein D
MLLNLLAAVILCKPVCAEDSIRILMHVDPQTPIPSDDSEVLGRVNGKVFHRGSIYEGKLELRRNDNGMFVINNLPFSRYVAGVVASETGKDWEPEALKAQAVISRTYAVFHKEKNLEKDYHLTSGTLHQVYRSNKVSPRVKESVSATEGEVLTFDNLPIKAFYHATCEGKTELPEEVWGVRYPYYQSVDCMTRHAPYDNWRKVFDTGQIEAATGISGVEDMIISSYTSTGRAKMLILRTGDEKEGIGEREISATKLRQLLGFRDLPSTDFSVTNEKGSLIFEGRGWGHGVGLSQWGALEMARQGKNYREILSHFYPGTVLRSGSLRALNDASQDKGIRPASADVVGTGD